MRIWLRSYAPLFLLIFSVMFLWIMQWSSLNLPYFWDEMGVYGKGIQYLLIHGIGILPQSLPPELSRGHPILFYSIHALILKFGVNEFYISHAASLIFSSLCLIATYLLAKEFLPKILAAMTSCLLVVQSIFLAQSSLVLPEILIALISISSILTFFKGRYAWTILILCIGVMLKESVIIIAAFLGLVYFLQTLSERRLFKQWKNLLGFTLPLLTLLIYLQIQQEHHGWYFFPYHTDILQESAMSGFGEKLQTHLRFILFNQGRRYWSLAIFVALSSLFLVRERGKLLLVFSFIAVNIGLFSFAFYMDRYLLFIYPLLAIIVVFGVYQVSFRNKAISFLIVLLLCWLSYNQHKTTTFRYDVNLAYKDLVNAHLEAVSSLCEQPTETLSCYANFPINASLEDITLGYISSACREKVSLVPLTEKPSFLLLHAMEAPEGYALLNTFIHQQTRIDMYKRIYPDSYH